MENTQRTWAKIPLFDDYWIDFKKNVIRRWYQPKLLSEYRDPNFNGCYQSACWSPEQGKYLLWHEYLVDPKDDEYRYLAVAASDDGYTWKELNVCGEPDPANKVFPNTVYKGNPGLHGTHVTYDPYDPDPDRRYKLMGGNHAQNYRDFGIENSAVYVTFSPDGIHWKEAEECRVHPNTSDTLNCLYYNPVTKEYNAIIRASYVERRIGQTTSKDLIHWTRPKVIIHPGAEFNDDAYATQLYGMSVKWMGGYFLGCLWRYYTSCADFDFSKMRGFQDTELMYSYDGEHWMHTSGRALVERPCMPEIGASSLLISAMYENKEDTKLFLVASGTCTMHSSMEEHQKRKKVDRPSQGVLTYEIRKDGFCGLEANTTDGLIVTKSFELMEPELYINANATFGTVRFSIIDHRGNTYEGFDFDDCVPLVEDEIRHALTFKEHSLDELVGKRIRLSIRMDGAVLHCIEGAIRPWIRYPQVSINDPVQVTYDEQK